jgi:hypothetical protein
MEITSNTNLVRAMKLKTNEKVLTEVKQRKIIEEQLHDKKR